MSRKSGAVSSCRFADDCDFEALVTDTGVPQSQAGAMDCWVARPARVTASTACRGPYRATEYLPLHRRAII